VASPLAQATLQRYNRQQGRGVTVLPQVNRPVMPAPRRQPLATPTPNASLAQRIMASPNLMAQAGAERAQPQTGGSNLGGLGWLIGKAGKAGMGALTVMDYPRAVVNAALTEGVAELIQRMPDAEKYPTLDTDFSWSDIGTNIKEHKGFGETLVEPIMGAEGSDWNPWVKRAVGFAGDVATDPFTYLIGGTGGVAGKAARANYVTQLGKAQSEAAASLARSKAMRELVEGGARETLESTIEQQARQAARLGGDEAREKIMRQGVNIANREQLAAMDPTLQHAIRLGHKGPIIPGTENLSYGISRALGPVKAGVSASPVGRAARALSVPQGAIGQSLRAPMDRLVSGRGAMPVDQALAALDYNAMAREARGTFGSVGARYVDNLAQELEDVPLEQRAAMQRAAEGAGEVNALTPMAERMRATAKELDVDIPELEGYVVPRVMARDAFRWMNSLKKGENPAVDTFRKVVGIENKDLLEEGGFMLRRSLVPGKNPDGSVKPLVLKFGKNQEDQIEILTGTMAELEDKLGGYLRKHGFEGNLYEQDPVAAWRRYVQTTKYDVAKRSATVRGYKRGLPGFEKPGQLPGGYQPFVKVDLAPDENGVVRQMYVKNPEPAPPETEYFKYIDDEPRTTARNRRIGRKKNNVQREILKEFQEGAQGERENIAKDLERTANETWEPLTREKDELRQRQTREKAIASEALRNLTSTAEDRAQIQRAIRATDAEIRAIRRKLRFSQFGLAKRTAAEQRAMFGPLRDAYDAAFQRRAQLEEDLKNALEATGEPLSKAVKEKAKTLPTRRARARANALTVKYENTLRMYRKHLDMARETYKRKLRSGKKYIERDEYLEALARIERSKRGGAGPYDLPHISVVDEKGRLLSPPPEQFQGPTLERIKSEADEYLDMYNEKQVIGRDIVAGGTKQDELKSLRAEAVNELNQKGEDAVDALRRNELNDLIDNLDHEIQQWLLHTNNLINRRRNLDLHIKEHPLTKARDTVEAYDKQEADIMKYSGTDVFYDVGDKPRAVRRGTGPVQEAPTRVEPTIPREPTTKPTTLGRAKDEFGIPIEAPEFPGFPKDAPGPGQIDVKWAENQMMEARRDMEDFIRADIGEFERATRPPAPPPQFTPKEQAEYDHAMKSLGLDAEPRTQKFTEQEQAEYNRTMKGLDPKGQQLKADPEVSKYKRLKAQVDEFVTASENLNFLRLHGGKVGEVPWERTGPGTFEYEGWMIRKVEAGRSRGDRTVWEILNPDEAAAAKAGTLAAPQPGTAVDMPPPGAAEEVSAAVPEEALPAAPAAVPEEAVPPAPVAEAAPTVDWETTGPGHYTFGGYKVDKVRAEGQQTMYHVTDPKGRVSAHPSMVQARDFVEKEADVLGAGAAPEAPVVEEVVEAAPAAAPGPAKFDPLKTDPNSPAAQIPGLIPRKGGWVNPATSLQRPVQLGHIEYGELWEFQRNRVRHMVPSETATKRLERLGLIEKTTEKVPGVKNKGNSTAWKLTQRGREFAARVELKGGKFELLEADAASVQEAVAKIRSKTTGSTSFPEGGVMKEATPTPRDPNDPFKPAVPEPAPTGAAEITDELTDEALTAGPELNAGSYRKVHARPADADKFGKDAFEIVDWDGKVMTVVGGGREAAERAVKKRQATVKAMVTRRRNAAGAPKPVLEIPPKVVEEARPALSQVKPEPLPKPPGTMPTADEMAALLAAAKGVETPPAAPVVEAAAEAKKLTAPSLQQAKDKVAELVPPPPVQIPETSLAEFRAATDWIGKHPDVVEKVSKAEGTKRRLEATLASRAKETEDIGRVPFFPQVEKEQARMFAKAAELERKEQSLAADLIPQIVQAEHEEDLLRPALGAAWKKSGEIAERGERELASEVAGGMAARTALTEDKKALEGVAKELDDASGGFQQTYETAVANSEAARMRHDDIKKKMEPLSKPEHALPIVQDTAKGGRPTGADLERVAKGEMPAYEAQPLHRVVREIDQVIQANPAGQDFHMNRMEAVLHGNEEALTRLTLEYDLPAYQLDRIIKDANRGKLSPVLKSMLKSDWERVWDKSDYVIAKDLKHLYFNVAEQLDNKLFGRMLTSYTNFFKTYATMSPGFHVRNALSAFFMNASEGVTNSEQLAALRLWRNYANAADPLEWLKRRPPKIQDAFRATFASGASQFTETGVSQAAGAARRSERAFNNWATRLSQRTGQDWVEGPARLALALNTTRYGGSMNDAMNRITRIHFDYSQVSKFDEQMKRLIPFWTFMSRNVPLQFTQMWSKPKTYLHFQSFARNFAQQPPEFFPEYLEQSGGFDTGLRTPEWLSKVPIIGPPAGMPIAATPDLPHLRLRDDLNRIAGAVGGENPAQILSDFNPAFTAPAEFLTNQDFFTGRQYSETDVTKANAAMTIPAMLMSILGGGKRDPATGDWYTKDSAVNALRSLNPLLDRQMRLFPGIAGGSTSDPDRLLESWLRFGLGAPGRTISQNQMEGEAARRYFEQQDRMKALQAMGG